jgi:membrane fusion protein (multidrug efflux system)
LAADTETRADDTTSRDAPAADAGHDRNQSAKTDKQQDSDAQQDDQHRQRRWPLVVLAIVVILAILGGILYWFLTRNQESTVDAYTEGNAVSFAAKISGYVTQLDVNDNKAVKKGDLLLKIDPRDYVAARDQAQAALHLAQSQLSSAQVELEITRVRAPATLDQAKAQVATAEANRAQAESDYARQRAVDPRATTQTNVDQATAQLKSTHAAVQSAQAQVAIASLVGQTIQADEDVVKQRQAQVEQAQANLEQAEVNLSYTELRAPQDGTITRRNVDLGTFVQAGQQVFYIVTPQVWIVANFKETQLARMKPGQKVTIAVDAFPQLDLHGHVDSIQQGSGARFSAFPAENATGNFVKIVRRVPVKIIVDRGLPQGMTALPLGLSVEPTVDLE